MLAGHWLGASTKDVERRLRSAVHYRMIVAWRNLLLEVLDLEYQVPRALGVVAEAAGRRDGAQGLQGGLGRDML